MSFQRNYKVSGVFTTVTILLLVLIPIIMGHFALAQEVEQAPIETIEEVVVYGDKSLITLRQAVFRAQENFFELFSSLNDDDEYDIRCFYDVPTGTHIRRHVCRANFVTAATSAEAAVWFPIPQTPVVPAQTVINQKKRHLREKMETLISGRPEMREALINYTYTKQNYIDAKQKYTTE